ncbi:uncharacterized protein PG986_010297 [Apiospora aurea]|uniref:Rhodopsin domain-containing protein n=1 Tax=Apiospora aurea TaxID=335848 RepID=A0ABR1QA43_9PEZI
MTWVLTALASVSVALRISFRAQVKVFGGDDLFMIISMADSNKLCFVGWSITITLYASRGGTRHIWHVALLGEDNTAEVQLLNWTSQVFGIIGVAAGKISVSALLLGIIRQTELRWQRVYLWTFNTFADASLALIPITIFWSLQNKTAGRIQLSIVFSLNILTSICSGIKTQYLAELANREDLTWVTAELFLMIVCGTIPTLYPPLRGMRSVVSRLGSKGSASRSGPPSTSDLRSNDKTTVELVAIGRTKGRSQHDINYSQRQLLLG